MVGGIARVFIKMANGQNINNLLKREQVAEYTQESYMSRVNIGIHLLASHKSKRMLSFSNFSKTTSKDVVRKNSERRGIIIYLNV